MITGNIGSVNGYHLGGVVNNIVAVPLTPGWAYGNMA
jgi:hypothetical protein